MPIAPLPDRLDRVAAALRAAGLAPGDRCAVLARDDAEHLLLRRAAARAGVVLVALDPHSPVEWDLVVAEATALLLVCGAGFDGVRLPAMPVVGLDELFAAQPATARASSSAPCRSPA